MGFLPRKIRVAFSEESQLQQSCATKPTVHAECFSVSIIHRTLTWTTGSIMCICDLFAYMRVDKQRDPKSFEGLLLGIESAHSFDSGVTANRRREKPSTKWLTTAFKSECFCYALLTAPWLPVCIHKGQQLITTKDGESTLPNNGWAIHVRHPKSLDLTWTWFFKSN